MVIKKSMLTQFKNVDIATVHDGFHRYLVRIFYDSR